MAKEEREIKIIVKWNKEKLSYLLNGSIFYLIFIIMVITITTSLSSGYLLFLYSIILFGFGTYNFVMFDSKEVKIRRKYIKEL